MTIHNQVSYCKSIGCTHPTFDGDDFCAECVTVAKPGQERQLQPLPLTAGDIPSLRATTAEDPVVEANRQLLLQRSQVGIRKYGGTLHAMQYSQRELLQHALEEALDLANYLQAEIQRLDQQKLAA